MFRVRFSYDIMNEDPSKRRHIKGIIVTCGYYCNHLYCPYRSQCKYRKGFGHHNFSVSVHNWIYRHTIGKLDIHFPWYFQKLHTNLAGTSKCPYSVSREDSFNCWQCKYICNDGHCSNEYYSYTSYQESRDPEHFGRCKFFKVNPYYLIYDSKTGKQVYKRKTE